MNVAIFIRKSKTQYESITKLNRQITVSVLTLTCKIWIVFCRSDFKFLAMKAETLNCTEEAAPDRGALELFQKRCGTSLDIEISDSIICSVLLLQGKLKFKNFLVHLASSYKLWLDLFLFISYVVLYIRFHFILFKFERF